MLRTQLQRKIPSYKVLGLFALLLVALLALFPSPSLVAPASDSTGLFSLCFQTQRVTRGLLLLSLFYAYCHLSIKRIRRLALFYGRNLL